MREATNAMAAREASGTPAASARRLPDQQAATAAARAAATDSVVTDEVATPAATRQQAEMIGAGRE